MIMTLFGPFALANCIIVNQDELKLIAACSSNPLHLQTQISAARISSTRELLNAFWGQTVKIGASSTNNSSTNHNNEDNQRGVATINELLSKVINIVQYFCDPVGKLESVDRQFGTLASLWETDGTAPQSLLKQVENICDRLGLYRSRLIVAKARSYCIKSIDAKHAETDTDPENEEILAAFTDQITDAAKVVGTMLEDMALKAPRPVLEERGVSSKNVKQDVNYCLSKFAVPIGSFEILARFSAVMDACVVLCGAMMIDSRELISDTSSVYFRIPLEDLAANECTSPSSHFDKNVTLVQRIISARIVAGALLLLLALCRRDHQIMTAVCKGYSKISAVATLHSPRNRARKQLKSSKKSNAANVQKQEFPPAPENDTPDSILPGRKWMMQLLEVSDDRAWLIQTKSLDIEEGDNARRRSKKYMLSDPSAFRKATVFAVRLMEFEAVTSMLDQVCHA